MKLQADQFEGVNIVSHLETNRVRVNGEPYASNVLVPWEGEVKRWSPASFEALGAAHFEEVLALEPELVIFGSGSRLRFVHPSMLKALIDRRIGVETMDSAAACRTYNVLAGEGRRVVAALLLETPA